MGLKDPYAPNVEFAKAAHEYVSGFAYSVELQLGPSYSADFKEFQAWAVKRLGVKYKDWFMMSSGKDKYRLYCKDTKWSMFLVLEHVDKIV